MIVKRDHLLVGGCLVVTGLGVGGCKPDPPPHKGGSSTAATAASSATITVRKPASKRCRPFCKIRGHCAYEPSLNACVARDDADCRASRGCRVTGLCTFQGDTCIGGSDEDCRASERCRDEGLCKFGPGAINVCMAASAADCRASTACKKDGRCGLVGELCQVVKTEDCRASTGCRGQGHCTLQRMGRLPNQKTRCGALSDDDCKNAKVCKDEGKCTAVEGLCQKAGAAAPATQGD
jgi:hypothetical protein